MKGQKMIKPKVVQRNGVLPFGVRVGMAVSMDDGWCGNVEQIDGDTVVCIRDGERPNDLLRGYRAFKRRCMTINGNKAIVNWKSAAPASRSTAAREQRQRDVVNYLKQRALEREWQSAPD